jgi:hypothetical protein
MGLVGLGCASCPDSTHAPDQALPGRPLANAPPAVDLRIPGKPVETTPNNSPVKQASAQVPADESSGPPLKIEPAPSPAGDSVAKLRSLYREAAKRYASIDSYIVRLRRREQVNGKDNPEEILCVKFRKRPWSVYFKWLGKEANGREVVYVKGQYEDKIHTLLAAGDMPLMPAGRRVALPADSVLVRSSSRHSIQEAGIGILIERFGKLLESAGSANQPEKLKYLGLLKRPEFDAPCEAVEQEVSAGAESLLPRGGRRLWAFDTITKFPVLIITQDHSGHEVEYYCYDRFQFPVRLDSDDFNPDKLWNQKRSPAAKSTP